jgi:DNA polymerase-3 subunit beta
MHIRTELLKDALAIAGRAVGSRNVLPVLSCTLIGINDHELRLHTSDLETYISLAIPIEEGWAEPGAVLVPWRLFSDLIGTWAGEPLVELEQGGDFALCATAGRSVTKIIGMDPDEFPRLPKPLPEERIQQVKRETLRELIRRVVFAASDDESRPILTGVLFRYDGQALTGVAADGFRMSLLESPVTEGLGEPFSIVVPAETLTEIDALLAKSTAETVRFAYQDNRLEVEVDEVDLAGAVASAKLTTQLIEGNYVNYRQIVPTEHAIRAVVARGALMRALKTVDVVARQDANLVELVFLEEGLLDLQARSEAMGEASAEVACELDGEARTVLVNGRMLADGLSAAGGSEWLAIEQAAPTKPLAIRDANKGEGDPWLYVQMPMHRKG